MSFIIVLASNSPRRKELLTKMGVAFKIRIKEVNEDFPSHLSPKEVAEYLAKKKSSAYRASVMPNELVITADTLVSCKDKILNKPETQKEARQMLEFLSNNTHEVITGVSLMTSKKQLVFSVISKVTFGELSTKEIIKYVDSGLPMDKAGAYGIQDWIGTIGVTKIEGSYENIVGLPTQELHRQLKGFIA
ncbi:MAG: Maf family nucleotide pyrophosphatase [Salibacteraceae bacterium]|nr:Maf family nucleotide pyrophosphatase [Salibacteraceae bacterium]